MISSWFHVLSNQSHKILCTNYLYWVKSTFVYRVQRSSAAITPICPPWTRSPQAWPFNPVILTFSQSQYKYFSHKLARTSQDDWNLYCDWVKSSMTSRVVSCNPFLWWSCRFASFSLAGTRVPKPLRSVVVWPCRKGLGFGLNPLITKKRWHPPGQSARVSSLVRTIKNWSGPSHI